MPEQAIRRKPDGQSDQGAGGKPNHPVEIGFHYFG
jgi:hypothetical protein